MSSKCAPGTLPGEFLLVATVEVKRSKESIRRPSGPSGPWRSPVRSRERMWARGRRTTNASEASGRSEDSFWSSFCKRAARDAARPAGRTGDSRVARTTERALQKVVMYARNTTGRESTSRLGRTETVRFVPSKRPVRGTNRETRFDDRLGYFLDGV